MKKAFLAVISLILLVATAFSQNGDLPKFEDFAVKPTRTIAKPVNLKSHKDARMFRTRLKEAQKAGVNFAGSYILATWGCGTSCYQGAIIDAKTGNVYFPLELSGASIGFGELNDVEEPLQYKPNSRLLIIYGFPGIGESEKKSEYGVYYYEWKNNRFDLVKFVPKKEENFDSDDQR